MSHNDSPEGLPVQRRGNDQRTLAVPRDSVSGESRRRPSDAKAAEFSLWTVWDAVRFSWKWALPSGLLLAGVAAAAIWHFYRPSYEASAWLQIADTRPVLVFNVETTERSQSYVSTQTELLRSPVVIGPVVASLNDAGAPTVPELKQVEDPIAWLGREIKVTQRQRSELFTVSFRSRNPEAAAFVVDRVLNSYFKLQDQQEAKRNKAVVEKLEEVNRGKLAEITQLRMSLAELAKSSPDTELFFPRTRTPGAASSPLTDLQNRIITAEVEEKTLEAKLKVQEETTARSPAVVPQSIVDKAVADSAEVKQLTADVEAGMALLRDMESRVVKGKDDPLCQKTRAELQQQEKTLQSLRQDIRARVTKELENSLNGKRDELLAALRSDLESRRLAKKYLLEQREKELRSAQTDTGVVLNLKTKKDQLERAEFVYDAIADRILKLQTERSAPARVALLQSADVPKEPVEKWPKALLVVPALFAFPFGLALLKEHLARRIRNSHSVEDYMHWAVLGEITQPPQFPVGRQADANLRQQRSLRLLEECVDNLRTRLFVAEDLQSVRFLAITSAIRHEGKSSVSVQLAASIARATHEPTLLIDGDLRAPTTHQVFQIERWPGVAEVLAGNCTLSDAVQATWLENLHVLPAGNLEGSPHRLLSEGSLRSLLQSIPVKYRHVIIDTPPVLAASESLVLAKHADACLLCVMRDVTRTTQAKTAGDRLVAAGARLAGVVVNGVTSGQYIRRYGHYAYDYNYSE